MRKTLGLIIALMLTANVWAQTMNVETGSVVYQFPAAKAGVMTYTDGTSLTIMGKTFTLSELTNVWVDDAQVIDNTVSVVYDGTSARVLVAGNVAQYVTPAVKGAHVGIGQTNTSDVDGEEIIYSLSGNTSDGEFYLSGSYKCTVELCGLTLTNASPVFSGAAIHVQNGKRIDISIRKDTENTLADCPNGTQKGCLYVKGHAELKGQGTLNIKGNLKHGIKTGEYLTMRKCGVNILSTEGDGINCSQYFLMESGSLTFDNVGDDAIQCDIDNATAGSTGQTTNHEDEDSGNIYIKEGTVDATVTNTAAKCLKAEGNVIIDGGTLTLKANGDIDLTDTSDPAFTAGIRADSYEQNGGNIDVVVNGAAGRGVTAANSLTINGGTLNVINDGATKSSGSSYFCSARGLRASTILLKSGTLTVSTSGAASKGIKADDGHVTVTGGNITITTTGAGAYDGEDKDAKGCAGLDAEGDINIEGGSLTLKSSGTGGKGMKCDGTLTIIDGTVNASSTGSNYKYSNSLSASAKAIKAGVAIQKGSGRNATYEYSGGIVITGGNIIASASNHEAIESKSTLDISGGYVYANSSDDAINSSSDFTISGGFVMGNSSGNDGLDANGNFYIKGGTVFSVASSTPEVGIDANTEQGYKLYVTGGNIVAIGGLERGSSLSQACYQASSYTKGAWYALYEGSTLVLAFKVPSNSRMGTPMVVSTAGNTALKSGVSVSGGTKIWVENGCLDCSVNSGSSVSLSSYTGGGGGGWRPW